MSIGQSKAMWQCNLHNLVANLANNANGATWWLNFEPMQVEPSVGKICNLQLMQVAPSGGQICKWCHVVAKFNPNHGVNVWVRCASGNVLFHRCPRFSLSVVVVVVNVIITIDAPGVMTQKEVMEAFVRSVVLYFHLYMHSTSDMIVHSFSKWYVW